MSPKPETNLSSVYLTRSSSSDYKKLCSLEKLGLEEIPARLRRANFKSNWCATQRGGKSLVCYGKLDIHLFLTITKAVLHGYLTS